MTKFYILLLTAFVFINSDVPAQVLSIAWQKTLGGPGNDVLDDIYPTADGNYILFGLYTDNGIDIDTSCHAHGIHDVWIVKMDPAGNIIWQQCMGGSKEEGNPFSKIIQTSDGGYLFVTETWSNDFDVVGHHAYSDAWTVKMDANGAVEWKHSFGGSVFDVPRNLYELPGHKYMVMSRTNSSDGDVPPSEDSLLYDAWIFIVDNAGNIVTNKIYGGTGDDDLYKALPTTDGNIALFGLTTSSDGDLAGLQVDSTNAWMLKIDTDGNVLSSQVYGGLHNELFYDALNTDDGGFIAFGESGDPGMPVEQGSWHGDQDYWAVKLDVNGLIQWQGLYGGSGKEQPRRGCKLAGNAGYLFAGSTNSADGDVIIPSGRARDWWVLQLSPDGTLISSVALGGSGSDFCNGLTAPGIAVGAAFSNDGDVIGLDGTADGWVLQLDFATNAQDPELQSKEIKLFPNPASSLLNIQIVGIEKADLIEIRNVLGQVLYSTVPSAGHIETDVSKWSPGIYCVIISDASDNKKNYRKSFEVIR